MYRSTKENKGEYTLKTFIKRGIELTSISEFNSFRKRYLPQMGGVKCLFLLFDYYTSLVRYGATVSDFFEY